MKHVIIGAGIAGTTAAKTIRSIDKDAEIILINAEQFLPYNRFLLTEYLVGAIDKNKLFYLGCENFKQSKISFRKGEFVKQIKPSEKTVKLNHNEVITYDKLLIATGGSPALGPILRPCENFLFPYYSLGDILKLQKKLKNINECIICGEGASILDLLSGMKNLGKKVKYIVKGDKASFPLIQSGFDGELHDFLIEKGIEIITNDRVVTIQQHNNKYYVKTLNQKEFLTDIVFGWDYYKPNVPFVEQTGIEKKTGILVDQQLRSSKEDIFAAGDCVEIYHPLIKDYWINFGWPNAMKQGEIAGKNMTGENLTYEARDAIVFNLMGKPIRARWWE